MGTEENLTIPELLVRMAKEFEGFYPAPYLCPAGYWTVGYGHLCRPDHPPVTEREATELLLDDLEAAVDASLRLCPVLLAEREQRLAAVADFAFNLGAGRLQMSTLRRRVNQRDWEEAARQIRRWVWGGGRVLPGLVRRREVEAALLLGIEPARTVRAA
jgi:lysozyme